MNITPDAISLSGTLDMASSPMQASPGDARVAVNYEPVFSGGYVSVGGYERFDGRARPSDATYQAFSGTFTGIAVGDAITVQDSEATAVVALVGPALVLTDISGEIGAGDILRKGAAVVGTITASPAVYAKDDNTYSAAAANIYRNRISAPPGTGPVRGLAILNDTLYAWRDNGASCRIFRSSASGWQEVAMLFEVAFSTGSVAPTEGGTITRSGVSAVVRRVIVETGTWAGGNAAGRLICEAPTGGTFSAGALTSGGTLTLTATLGGQVQRQVSLLAGGRVQAESGNFTAALATRRLYGCDGVNPEFEFDGTVYAPITTGMPTRARAVAIHKSRLWFGYENSVQYSGISDPHKWTPIFGAQELGTGDPVTNLTILGGSEDNAALQVTCRDSLHVLYGSTSTDFKMVPLSGRRGAAQYSVQDLMTPVGVDVPGLVAFAPTQSFGNFETELISRSIEPLVREKTVISSVVARGLVRYRVFFDDGTAISCTPAKGGYRFGQLAYDRLMSIAISGEINGKERVFYGGSDGFVYEADVGRSFDGREIACYLKLAALAQRSPLVEKAYRDAYLEIFSRGYVELSYSAEYDDSDPQVSPLLQQLTEVFGAGGVFDVSSFDAAYFDARERDRKQLEMMGVGFNIAPIFFSRSNNQRQHELSTLTLLYAMRRFVR